jgi:hypothetical protein
VKIRLLKIDAMERFAEWLDVNSVHMSLWSANINDKTFFGLEKRQKKADDRDKFWNSRCKMRPNTYGDSFLAPRIEQSIKADRLLNYIIKRKSR